MNSDIQTEAHEAILSIRINRPEKQNALTHDMYTALANAMQEADDDPTIRVIFLTGTQECFTAGNDIGDFMNKPPSDSDSPVFIFLRVLARLKKPLVVAANGPAIGIGTTLFLHADLVYLGAQTELKMPFVNLGLCPEAASSLLLPQLVGHQRAAQALLLGESLDAKQALDWGLVNDVFAANTYQTQAFAKAIQLSKQPAEYPPIAKLSNHPIHEV